jgi:hypothetical protein
MNYMGKNHRPRRDLDDVWERPAPKVPTGGFCKIGLAGCTVVVTTYAGRFPSCAACASKQP